jgi:hypothetical protein
MIYSTCGYIDIIFDGVDPVDEEEYETAEVEETASELEIEMEGVGSE